MIHIMDGEWKLSNKPELILPILPIIQLIKHRKLNFTVIDIEKIAYKDLSMIDKTSLRYTLANTEYPVIVILGMENPFNKEYRLIDGRHRVLKHLTAGAKEIAAYNLAEEDIERFYLPLLKK